MKKILFTVIMVLFATYTYATEYKYVKGAYTKDIMSLSLMCEAIFDKDKDKLEFLYGADMMKLAPDPIEVRDVKIVPRKDAFVELPADMVEFKLVGDYRTYYTITSFLTTVLK